MKKIILILITSIFLSGTILSAVGRYTVSDDMDSDRRVNDGHGGHSH